MWDKEDTVSITFESQKNAYDFCTVNQSKTNMNLFQLKACSRIKRNILNWNERKYNTEVFLISIGKVRRDIKANQIGNRLKRVCVLEINKSLSLYLKRVGNH